MAEQTTLSPSRGEVITSVEPDLVFLEARNAYLLAQDALTKANQAYSFAQTVESNASNAASQATTAISLANAAQNTANQALASQVSITGATLTGPLYLNSINPAAPYEAAAKQYVDNQVGTVVADSITSVAALKADKTYVDSQDTILQNQINTGATQIADLYTKLFPPGGIIMWSGSVANIPTGWRLCDGANNTPDLRNRFILGAGTGANITAPLTTGGASTGTTSLNGDHTHNATLEASGAHAHNITVTGTALTLAQIPAHSHQFGFSESSTQTGGGGQRLNDIATTGGQTVTTTAVGSGATHDHPASSDTQGSHTHVGTIQTDGAHTHTVSTVPPFYALCFIMKT